MLRSPARIVRSITTERKGSWRSAWRLTKSSTKRTTEQNGSNVSLREAKHGIYSIKIGKMMLPLLGTEVGRIPLWYPGKTSEKKSPEAVLNKDISKRNDDGLRERRIPETYVDRVSVSENYSPAMPQIGPITGGITFDPNEHPLLCDLDETRDAVMYGRGREFVENVKRVRGLLVGFHKWELTERAYRWAIIVLQLCILFLAYATWYQDRVSNILMSSYNLYDEYTDRQMHDSEEKRWTSVQKALSVAIKATSKATNLSEMITDAQIRIRRELLPDSSDLSAIVKARMKVYHEEKHQKKTFPT